DNLITPPYFGSAPISEDTYHRLREGDTILIRYLPDNPDVSALVSDGIDDTFLDTLISLLFIGVGLAGVYAIYGMWRSNRRLLSRGQLIAGSIRSAHGNKVKGSYQVTIDYSFTPRDGQAIEAYQTGTRDDLKDAVLPEKGALIAVLYVDD